MSQSFWYPQLTALGYLKLAAVIAGPNTCGLMIVATKQHETLCSHILVKWLDPSVYIYICMYVWFLMLWSRWLLVTILKTINYFPVCYLYVSAMYCISMLPLCFSNVLHYMLSPCSSYHICFSIPGKPHFLFPFVCYLAHGKYQATASPHTNTSQWPLLLT